MTPKEWKKPNLRTGSPLCGPFDFLIGRITSRQIGLFLVACARRVWKSLDNVVFRKAVETTERYLLQEVPQSEMEEAWQSIQGISAPGAGGIYWLTNGQGSFDTQNGWEGADEFAKLATNPTREAAAQMEVLRDIFGDPFRPVIPDPKWFTSTVVTLARGIYEEQAFDRMPILADAIQDAGCENARVLDHCRQVQKHVRGCWVVDMILNHNPTLNANEWDFSNDVQLMIRSAWPRTSDRKLRLFACGCCRQASEFQSNDMSWWRTLIAAEQFSDNQPVSERDEIYFDHDRYRGGDVGTSWAFGRLSWIRRDHPAHLAAEAAEYLCYDAGNNANFEPEWRLVADERRTAPLRLLRCVFGNPLRPPVKFLKKWKSAEVLKLAHAIYDSHSFDRMPKLASLLEKAGCTNPAILAHCRDKGPFPNGVPKSYPVPTPPIHCRGCWVVDGILELK